LVIVDNKSEGIAFRPLCSDLRRRSYPWGWAGNRPFLKQVWKDVRRLETGVTRRPFLFIGKGDTMRW